MLNSSCEFWNKSAKRFGTLVLLWIIGAGSLQAQSYCQSYSDSTGLFDIVNVEFGGIVNSSVCGNPATGANSIGGSYSNFTYLPAAVAAQGQTVPFSIAVDSCSNSLYVTSVSIFIDYNQDGVFNVQDELVFQSPGVMAGSYTTVGSVTIPITATPGSTRLRIINRSTGMPYISPCGNYQYGETEDYGIIISQTPDCAGMPIAGSTPDSVLVCHETSATITASGYTYVPGVSFFWEESTDNGLSWQPALGMGANSPQFITPPVSFQNAGIRYRFNVSCAISGLTATSGSTVISNTDFFQCYCTSSATSSSDGDITNVTIGALNNSSVCMALAPGQGSVAGRYSNFTALPPANLTQGDTIELSLTSAQCSNINVVHGFAVFIDLNHNGIFDFGERVYVSPVSGTGTETGSFVMPFGGLPGVTLMRVVMRETSMPLYIPPCGSYVWGETEDYIVNIIPGQQVPCLGALSAGVTPAFISVCPGNSVGIEAIGASVGFGYSYEWQYSLDSGSAWTQIPGAWNSPQLPNYSITTALSGIQIRMVITCTASGLTDTTGITIITVIPPMQCYCTSAATSSSDGDITNVTVGTYSNNSLCQALATGAGSVAGQYSNFTSLLPVDMVQGDTVPVSLTTMQCNNITLPGSSAIFIDFNRNGIFDFPQERVYVSDSAGLGVETGEIVIPLNASPGLTRMRVVNMETSNPTIITPCGSYVWGETEDYMVNITVDSASVSSPEEVKITNNVLVYPNPNTGNFTIKLQDCQPGDLQIRLVNLLGQEVYAEAATAKNTAFEHQLNVQNLPEGMYVLHVQQSGKSYTKQVVIQK